MYETDADLRQLQDLLDRSAASEGPHMASILTPERRLSARQLTERLTGMCLLTLATVTAKGEPRTGPVDGLFYRGAFWFGSSHDSVRFRHIDARPAVSTTHLPSEALAVVVHGRAVPVDVKDDALRGFRELCINIYGDGWNDWGASARYARIDAERMYTYHNPDAAKPDAAPDETTGDAET